jgi:tellurite resistance protein
MKAKKLDRLGVIKQRIYDARDALSELDIQKVKRIYTEIMLDYNTLSDKEKASVYEDIKEVYDDRKNAEAISKK